MAAAWVAPTAALKAVRMAEQTAGTKVAPRAERTAVKTVDPKVELWEQRWAARWVGMKVARSVEKRAHSMVALWVGWMAVH